MQKRSVLLSLGVLLARPALALYDPKPHPLLLPAIGAWRGTLTYADYQNPDKTVTLDTRLMVTLAGPDELSLYHVFDDGPGKTVYSYEHMEFDWSKGELTWRNGSAKPSPSQYRISSAVAIPDGARIEFGRHVESGVDAYTFEVSARSWQLTKREVRPGKPDLQRSQYTYAKA